LLAGFCPKKTEVFREGEEKGGPILEYYTTHKKECRLFFCRGGKGKGSSLSGGRDDFYENSCRDREGAVMLRGEQGKGRVVRPRKSSHLRKSVCKKGIV